MTKEQRDLHQRMNAGITTAIGQLMYDFDIENRDLGLDGLGEINVIRADLKKVLLAAYARNHSWIEEAA